MSSGGEQAGKEGGIEKGSRFLRNFNLAVGLGSLAVGAALSSELLVAYGVFNVAQAGFFEMTRRLAKRRKAGPKLGRVAMSSA